MLGRPLTALLFILIAGCTSSLNGAAAPDTLIAQNVSVRDIRFTGHNNEPFHARLWHPTSDDNIETFGQSRIRPGYQAVPDGELSLSKPAPLIILVHGSGGSADSMAWLALGLAKSGAIVVAADHPDSSGGNPERRSILDLWTQPRDVSLMLDQLKTTKWASHIDADRISVVGFSLGGTSALMLSGARLEFKKYPEFCDNHDDGACRAFRQHFSSMDDASFYAKTNADYADKRLTASVAIAPGFTETMTPDSILNLKAPTLILTGANDQQLPPNTHMAPIRDYVRSPDVYKSIIGAQHFSFLPLCGPDAVNILAETNEEFVCEEVGDKTRTEIHAEVLEEVTGFLCRQNRLDQCAR
ncbi:MAG: hypothetical protein DHS20C05_19330 [Hyphococcus sp.]|nr:MAG: hypothetical protein DHS20C05_19330 [Marinicaulis sp.]